jgi:hypothetical protein
LPDPVGEQLVRTGGRRTEGHPDHLARRGRPDRRTPCGRSLHRRAVLRVFSHGRDPAALARPTRRPDRGVPHAVGPRGLSAPREGPSCASARPGDAGCGARILWRISSEPLGTRRRRSGGGVSACGAVVHHATGVFTSMRVRPKWHLSNRFCRFATASRLVRAAACHGKHSPVVGETRCQTESLVDL